MPAAPCAACAAALPWSSPSGRRPISFPCKYIMRNSIEGVRVALEKSGERLSWIGGEKGDSGVPRFVPMFFGLEFAERLGKMIDEQIEHLARSAIGGHKRRKRGG